MQDNMNNYDSHKYSWLFGYDPADQIISMTLDHQPLISNISYLPFGPVRSFRAGSMVFNRDFDRRYQVTRMNGGSSDRRYTRDKNGRVTGITNVRTPSPRDFPVFIFGNGVTHNFLVFSLGKGVITWAPANADVH